MEQGRLKAFRSFSSAVFISLFLIVVALNSVSSVSEARDLKFAVEEYFQKTYPNKEEETRAARVLVRGFRDKDNFLSAMKASFLLKDIYFDATLLPPPDFSRKVLTLGFEAYKEVKRLDRLAWFQENRQNFKDFFTSGAISAFVGSVLVIGLSALNIINMDWDQIRGPMIAIDSLFLAPALYLTFRQAEDSSEYRSFLKEVYDLSERSCLNRLKSLASLK